MSGSQACRDSPHGPIEKEMCNLKAKKNKSFWMFTEPDTFFHCFVCLCYMYFLFILLPQFVLIMYSMFQSYDDNLLCGWTSSCFFIGQNIIIVSFAIRIKAALKTLMQIYLAIYMALHVFFFLARFARSVFKTLINNKMYCTIRHKHKSIHHIVY